MSTIVFNAAIAWGDVFPLVPVARRLLDGGHRVRFVLPTGFHPAMSDLGFEVLPAGYELSPEELAADPAMDSDRWLGLHWGRGIMRRYLLPFADQAFEALDAAAEGADLVVTQQTLPFGRTVAEHRGIPWATFVMVPMGLPSRTSLAGGEGSRATNAARSCGYRAADLAWRAWLGGAQVQDLRRRLGLPAMQGSLPMAGISPHKVVVAHSPQFVERPQGWPASAVLTGLSCWDWPADRKPAGVDEFLGDGEPPVLVTLGSAPTSEAQLLVDDAVAAVRSLGRRGLLLVRDGTTPSRPGDDVACFTGAPLHDVMERSCAVVHKGGYGTTAAALTAGTPMVTVGRQLEHQWYGRRAAELGLGQPAPWRPSRRAALVEALRTVVEQPAYARRAADMARRLEREDGPGQATAHLLELVGAPNGPVGARRD